MALFTRVKIPSYQNRLSYHAILLSQICLIAGLAIVFVSLYSTPKIKMALKQDTLNLLIQVIPEKMYNNAIADDTFLLNNQEKDGSTLPPTEINIARQDSQISGFAFTSQSEGYGGTIKVLLGLDKAGTILGVRVLSHKETPGLGDKIEISKAPWITTFNGRSLSNTSSEQWAVKKDGGVFDQFTGATITPRAVVAAVYSGLDKFERNKSTLLALRESETDIAQGDPQ